MRFEDRRNMGGEDAKSRKMFPAKLFEILVRIVPAILCVAAMVMMLNNHQISEDGALQYDNVAGFKYVVYANGICAGYSVFSAVGSALCGSYGLPGAWILFIFDQALTYTMVAAGGVATEVLYLGYRGDEEAVWSKGCVSYAKFCNRAAASVVVTFVALGCFVMLSLLSAHRLFSNYEPPLQANRELTASQA